MKTVVCFLAAIIICVMGFATFLEQAHGAAFAQTAVYHTWWFFALWTALAALSIVIICRARLWRRFWVGMLHVALLLILVGAATTFFTSREGRMTLHTGETKNVYEVKGKTMPLPVSLHLEKFDIEFYPGTQAPSDFVSKVSYNYQGQHAKATISMNHILSVGGYRFYQYSPMQDGTVLSVTYDPWGTPLTYFAYALLGISMLGVLLSRGEEFRKLLRSPLLRRSFILLLLMGSALTTQARSIPTINSEKAERAARMQVIYNDRVAPLSTMAHDFLSKIYGKTSYKGLSPEQVVYGWMARPDAWKDEPMILVKNGKLRRLLGAKDKYLSLAQLFDGDEYKLTKMLPAGEKPDKAMMELDEKVGLIIMLTQGQLIKPVPEGTPRLSETHVNAEIFYNHVPFSKLLFMFCLTMGFLSFFYMIWRMTHPYSGRRDWMKRFFRGCLYIAFVVHLIGYALHWYIAGRIPLGNGYETMLFMALMMLLLTVCLHRRFSYLLPFGFLLAGFSLLVAWLGQRNPQITPLMPVLQSPLLSAHVSVIMMAYALLAFMMLNGIFALILMQTKMERERISQLTLLSRLMLYPAVFLLAAGIFLGAVWANVSWGKYWSWDPKEVWALITLLIYAVPFHWQSLPTLRRPAVFHAYLVIAFLTVLMTYFGVNYFLGGMHSYA